MAGVFTRLRAFSFRHPHFPSLHPKAYAGASMLRERSPTPAHRTNRRTSHCFGGRLAVPTILGATSLDW